MDTTTSGSPGFMTGVRYLNSLQDNREVWLDGEKISDVTNHKSFTGVINELARIYDLQADPKFQADMTFRDKGTGKRFSVSWMLPTSPDDLRRKRKNSEIWNQQCWGQLGRGPDILSSYIITLYNARSNFSKIRNPSCDFGENIANYYRYCRDNDLFLTHALGDPQVDRSEQPQNEQRAAREEDLALHVVEETLEGIIVQGAKQLATAAPITNETYVSLSATFVRRSDPRFILSFAIPTNSKGLKILCREPVSGGNGGCGHPFGMLYDEQDAMLFFENVLVPWERVFMLYDASPVLLRYTGQANFAEWGNLCRIHERMKLLTEVATMIAEAIGVKEYREVSAKLGEMITYVEMWRHAMDGVEQNSYLTEGGLMSLGSLSGMNIFFAQMSSRMVQLLREIAGSGLIMQPSELDLSNKELRPYLERFMRGKGVDVAYKSRLFRLANDLAVSSFGMRQEIYEYWHGGDPNRNRINLLNQYDQSEIMARVDDLVSQPLANGEV